jgi:hypothetical protein
LIGSKLVERFVESEVVGGAGEFTGIIYPPMFVAVFPPLDRLHEFFLLDSLFPHMEIVSFTYDNFDRVAKNIQRDILRQRCAQSTDPGSIGCHDRCR